MRNNIFIIIAALFIGVLGGWYFGTSQPAYGLSKQSAMNTNSKAETIKMDMRKLWEDHITWTRAYLISAAADSAQKDADTKRLLKNQEDIGNAIKPYYGEAAGGKLTMLLKEHIATAVDLVTAAKANDQAAMNAANNKWYKNANDIADFLAAANPNWPKDQARAMMKEHLDLTKQEAADILGGKYEENVTDYDKVHAQILKMADMLSAGILKQFPEKF